MKTRIALNGNEGNWRIGIGELARFECHHSCDWNLLDTFLEEFRDRTRFIMLSYELRTAIYPLTNEASHRFPLISVWVPESYYEVLEGELTLKEGVVDPENENKAIECFKEDQSSLPPLVWKARQTKSDYLKQLHLLKNQIQQGNIYEINYCQEFFAEKAHLSSVIPLYQALNAVSKAPYSVLVESAEWMIAGASPERFIARKGNRLFSEPIKGTAPRGVNEVQDQQFKSQLAESHKDRTENVMIVDLVRNDLSRIAVKNSVKVDELFGIYSFPTVHQMISTVSCEVKEEVTFSEIIKATFPMGSMTGAPKVAAMKLSEQTERFTRGIYSGSIGYMAPNGDFDLNVMIRSIVYDRENNYLSCGVGGAITMLSDPADEYNECLTKVGKILAATGTCQW